MSAPFVHRPSEDPFASLNPQQRDAVEHGMDRRGLQGEALLVVAGAGSGKTTTLASRVVRLVLAGADPNRILLLTFARRAAREMEHRVGRTLHRALGLGSTLQPPRMPWCGTFHGIGARLLRDYAPHIGLESSFTILDRGDSEDLLGRVRQRLGFGDPRGRTRFPLKGTCLGIYSRAVNSQQPLTSLLRDFFPWCSTHEESLQTLFAAYVDEKHRQAVLDFDDLLLWWSRLMAEPTLAAHVAARFDHVLVDEYQDTSRLQEALLLAIKPDGRGLTVVGDDAQSIYGFRAADVRNILGFAQRFDPPARIVSLERNYRSTQPVLDASNAVIALASERFAKTLWTDRAASQRPQLVTVEDEAGQARAVADQVLAHRESGLRLKRQAVLFRAAHHSAALELELARRQIPFVKFGGLQFLDAAHVKDVLSVLRWVENPRGRLAGLRVALLVPGLGPASAERLLDAMDAADDPVAARRAFTPPSGAKLEWAALVALLESLRESTWPDDVERVNRWYQPHLERLHEDDRVRMADLTQLARLAHGAPDRRQFLADLTLDPPAATSDESGPPGLDEDYLILSTIHSAKGMEWQAVQILHAVDGCIPSDLATGDAAQIEEERRLLYVAMTRARRHLHILVPLRFHVSQQAQGRRPACLRGADALHPAGGRCRLLRRGRAAAAAVARGLAGAGGHRPAHRSAQRLATGLSATIEPGPRIASVRHPPAVHLPMTVHSTAVSLRLAGACIALAAALVFTSADAASPAPVAAEHGMVVTAQHLATKVGVDVLKDGGNAVDAAVAVGYALAVVYPAAGNIGGGGFMTIQLADGRRTFLDFREKAPLAATANMYLDAQGNVVPNLSTRGHLAVGVPGSVSGLETARVKYGTMKRAMLMAPAIHFAERGYVLEQGDVDMYTTRTEDFRSDAAAAAIYLNHGQPFQAGDKVVQKDLARTLREISAKGTDGFYKGWVAKAIVDSSQAGKGILTQADLDQYTTREMAPVECDYRGYHVVSAPPPSSGGVIICEIMNVLEGYPLGALGFHSAQSIHYQIEAMRHAYVDRNSYLGDPDFVRNPMARLLDKNYAASLRAAIDPHKAGVSQDLKPGVAPHEGTNTTHYSIVDRWGNAVSVTYTLNDWFGAAVVAAGTGVVLNDEMDDFTSKIGVPNMYGLVQGEANAIAPGKRPLSSMSPTIVTRDGRTVMVVGTPGGSRIITATLLTMLNVIDYGMTIQEAVDAPRFHQQWLPESTNFEPFALNPDTRAILQGWGQKLAGAQESNHLAAILVGAPSLAGKPVGKNRFYGANDPRRGTGLALGY